MGGTERETARRDRGALVITLNTEVHSLADGWRDSVAGDAHVAPNVTAANTVKHQRGGAQTRG